MYLGLDLGTSGLKAILMDIDQNIIGAANAPLTVDRPHDGWSEQDPNAWIIACEAVFDILKKTHPDALSKVVSIGLSGQMHGATLIDKDGQALRPSILWNDTRSHEEAAALDADPQFRSISGNIVFPGFTAPKLDWVRKYEADIFARTKMILLPKDFLRLWLTGDYVSDMSDASGTSWLDVEKREWSEGLLNATNLSLSHMPRLVEGSQASGQLRANLASRWGFKRAPLVAGGGGDNAASAIGMGVVKKGQGFLSLGTSGVLFSANDAYQPLAESAVHAFCHALPNTWHQMGVILAATDALNWYARILGKSAAELTDALGSDLQTPSGALFLPYLGGERTPHNSATARASFHGLSHAHDRNALTRAVIEGVAFAFRDCQEALKQTGTEIDQLIAVGGGSLSYYWLELCATVLNLPIAIPEHGDFGGSFGAARLALLAKENVSAQEICTTPEFASIIEPRFELMEDFAESYQDYCSKFHS